MFSKGKRIAVLVLSALAVMAPLLSAGGAKSDTASAPAVRTGVPGGPVTYPVSGGPKIIISRTVDRDIQPAGFSSYNETPGVKALIGQTGINVEFVELVDDTAYMLYLAGGNLPDIILSSKTFYPGGGAKMHEDGLAQDLTDLLPRYAPDYWKFINSGPEFYRAIREPDGKHYALAGYFRRPGSIYDAWTGLVARKEFLDKLGMAPPETAEELYQYLKRCKDELGVETPFMSDRNRFTGNDGLGIAFTGGSLSSAFGLPRTDAYQINGKIHYGSYEPQYRELLVFLHRLYSEKLLDNNFAVTDEPTAQANVLSGKTALIFTATSRIQSMTFAANYAPDFTLLGLPSMSTAKGVTPMYSYADDPVTTGMWCFLPETCRDVENSLKLLNYAHTEKGNILVNFGQEGTTFNFVNNEPVLTEFVTNNPQGLTLDGILRAYGILNFPITQDERMLRQRFPLQQQIQAMEVWAKSNGSQYRIVNNSILAANVDEYAALLTDINTYIAESQAQFISGALPLDRFDSYIANLKSMGMDRLLEILQASYDVYNR
jgi:putative aldouronate transport system substrate-binding protein